MNNPPGPDHPAYKHGMAHTKIYQIWANMKQRCLNPNSPEYRRYGGRGISVCPRWLSFENFYVDVGEAPKGKSFDRKDNSKDYTPDNWRWATPQQQAANTRMARLITYKGKTMTTSQWAKRLGLMPATLSNRRRRGYPLAKLLSPNKFWNR